MPSAKSQPRLMEELCPSECLSVSVRWPIDRKMIALLLKANQLTARNSGQGQGQGFLFAGVQTCLCSRPAGGSGLQREKLWVDDGKQTHDQQTEQRSNR